MIRVLGVLVMSVFLLIPALSFGVESCALTSSIEKTYSGSEIIKYNWVWVSAADGTASCTGVNMYGRIVKVVTDPSATAPTASYDIDINEDGLDVMNAALDNRSATLNEQAFAQKGTDAPGDVYVAGAVSAEVSAAGDTKGGRITIYLIP